MNLFLEITFEVGIVYAITQIIAESKLTAPIRGWLEVWSTNQPSSVFELGAKLVGWFLYTLTSCFMCTCVWVSFFVSFKFFNLAQYLGYTEFSVFWNGLFLSTLTWFLRAIEEKLTN